MSMDKSLIRKEQIRLRDGLGKDERCLFSEQISERLFSMEEYSLADTVMSYASFRSEVITDAINRRIMDEGKKLYLPRTYMDRKQMLFFQVKDMERDMETGTMGIREPIETCLRFDYHAESAARLEKGRVLMLMPGVAFDRDRHRLGYGGGYYDRYLTECDALRAHTILLAYGIQEVNAVPSETTDVRPGFVLTETGLM